MTGIGEIIKEHRKELALTQEQLSKELGISRSMLAHIEAGRRQITREVFLRFINLVRISPKALFSQLTGLSQDLVEDLLKDRSALELSFQMLMKVVYGRVSFDEALTTMWNAAKVFSAVAGHKDRGVENRNLNLSNSFEGIRLLRSYSRAQIQEVLPKKQ